MRIKTLSDKMKKDLFDLVKTKEDELGYFKKQDVKQFIKDLKEELLFEDPIERLPISTVSFNQIIGHSIDKLAGKELIEWK